MSAPASCAAQQCTAPAHTDGRGPWRCARAALHEACGGDAARTALTLPYIAGLLLPGGPRPARGGHAAPAAQLQLAAAAVQQQRGARHHARACPGRARVRAGAGRLRRGRAGPVRARRPRPHSARGMAARPPCRIVFMLGRCQAVHGSLGVLTWACMRPARRCPPARSRASRAWARRDLSDTVDLKKGDLLITRYRGIRNLLHEKWLQLL